MTDHRRQSGQSDYHRYATRPDRAFQKHPLLQRFLWVRRIVSTGRQVHHHDTQEHSLLGGQMLVFEFLAGASERITMVATAEQKDFPA